MSRRVTPKSLMKSMRKSMLAAGAPSRKGTKGRKINRRPPVKAEA